MSEGTVSFDITWEDEKVIRGIVDRAMRLLATSSDRPKRVDVVMDITAVHANGNPLRLEALLEADDFNFAHDIFGIRRHLDRTTGKLQNCFRPRFSHPTSSPH